MQIIDKQTYLWSYLSDEQKGLILDGEQLLSDSKHLSSISDYSFLVFPFAKAFEGFLKKLFLELGLIGEDEYYGDDIRIGKLLSPYFMKKHEGSLYKKLCLGKYAGKELTEDLWKAWKKGRNLVFHYFPHNFRKLTFDEALEIINDFGRIMARSVEKCAITLVKK